MRGSGTLAKVLAENRERVTLYRTLATLRTDVPLAEDLDALGWRGAHRHDMLRLIHKVFGSPKIMDNVPAWR